MNVVVSAIVNPWVTTFSFVVALAMRIQGQNLQILCRNQARVGRIPGRIERTPRAPPAWRETPSASSAFAQENPVPTRSGYRAEGTFAQLARAALAART